MLSDFAYPSTPKLWPIEAAATLAGMTPNLFSKGIERGEIPVTIVRVGERQQRFVRAAELNAWLEPQSRPAPHAPAGIADEVNLF